MSTLYDSALPIDIARTFLPDRRLLARLLGFAAQGGGGTKFEIRDQTGIPTGESTGKVEPMIWYAAGMGLIKPDLQADMWQVPLTTLGQVIFQEDPFLNERQTLWLLHLLLCRRLSRHSTQGVADAWFTIFADSQLRLGKTVNTDQAHKLLQERYGQLGYLKALAGVLLRMYQESNAWGLAAILTISATSETYQFQAAPTETSYYPLYTTYLYLMWDSLFVNEQQIALDQFIQETRLLNTLRWEAKDLNTWLEWMVAYGWIQLDRQTGSALLLRLKTTSDALHHTYSGLL